VEVAWLGQVPYAEMLVRQQARHQQVVQRSQPEALFLLEHPPTVTLGSHRSAQHLLGSTQDLACRGIAFCETNRGGDITYHGPGQLVAYPILALTAGEQDIRAYVGHLEEVLIRTSADFGVRAERLAGLRGIWVGNDKLAAIGVRVAQWVTMHGFALNVDVDLNGFKVMVPCGLSGRGVTSLATLCRPAPSLAQVVPRVVCHFEEVLQRSAAPVPAASAEQQEN
jgi:lipoate-protein ligase B